MFLALYSCLNILDVSIDNNILSIYSLTDFSVCMHCKNFDSGDIITYVKQRFMRGSPLVEGLWLTGE